MIRHSAKGKTKIQIKGLALGLNEEKMPNDVGIGEAIKFENARVESDGMTFSKRCGMKDFDSTYSFGTKKVLGFESITGTPENKLVVCTEDGIWMKEAGVWTKIFTPTTPATKPVSMVKYRDILLIAGYEKVITVIGSTAYYSGVQKPTTPPIVVAQAASTSTKAEENAFTKRDMSGWLRYTTSRLISAQPFKVTSDFDLSKVVLKLKKVGAPTGNIWAEIHSNRVGTSLTKNLSTNIVGQASDNVTCATVTTAYASYDFNFSGTKPPLVHDLTYYLLVYGDFTVSTTDFIYIGLDISSPSYANGSKWNINGSLVWLEIVGAVIVFEIWGTGTAIESIVAFGSLETGSHIHLKSQAADYMIAQSFKATEDMTVEEIDLALKKLCNPTCPGDRIWVEIHNSQVGTSLTRGASAGIVGDPSGYINVSSCPEYYHWIEFTFSGTKPPLTSGNTYYIVLYGEYAASSTAHMESTVQGGYGDGESFTISSGLAWFSPGSDMSFDIKASHVTAVKKEEYALTNLDEIGELRDAAARTIMAQSFKIPTAGSIGTIKLLLAKTGAPTGNLWVEIHGSQGGTSGTKNASTAIVGAASDNLDVSTISAWPTFTQYTLTFSGTKPTIVADRVYFLVVYASYAVSATAFISIGQDTIDSDYADGCRWELDAALAWTSKPDWDICFEIYYLAANLIGVYKYWITFYRSGNYPCESNPSDPTLAVTYIAGQEGYLTSIPVSTETQVDKKRIYRTTAGGAIGYFLEEILNAATTYIDQHPDADILGSDELEFDNDPPPLSDDIEVFDGRVWYVSRESSGFVYFSKADYPENVPDYNFYIFKDTVSTKEVSPVRRIEEYNNKLYVFKSNAIRALVKHGDELYDIDKIIDGTGTEAPSSVTEAGEFLMFLSNHKRIEVLFKSDVLMYPRPSNRAKRTLDSMNYSYAGICSAVHFQQENEYRIAIPTGSDTTNKKIVVYNYVLQKFSIDSCHRDMSCLGIINPAVGNSVLAYGSTIGELFLIDKGTLNDDGTSIVFDVRSGWMENTEKTVIRMIYLYHFLGATATGGPGDEKKKMKFMIYSNLRAAPVLEKELTSSTVTDDLLKITRNKIGAAAKGEFLSFRFLNSDDVSALRVSSMDLFVRKKGLRGTITG